MGFFKTNLLKSLEWVDNSSDTMVYKYPMDGRQIQYGSKLTVRESQVAVFLNKGKIADVFGPGMYTLQTSNLPILTQLMSWAYGFKSPFYADVYFVNTKQFTNQKWGTSNPITMRDADFGTIRLRGYGNYAFRVDDAAKFLKELFGTNSSFTTSDIGSYLKSIVVSTISDTIAESKISALDLASNLLEFSKITSETLGETFANLGLKLTNLVIENISFPEEVEKAIDTRSSMGVLADKMDTFVKYQSANAIRDAAKNEGGAAGVGTQLGTGLALGEMMKESLKSSSETKTAKSADAKFCPNCGAENPKGAKFCVECGTKLVAKGKCPNCGAEVGKSKFCPECGTKLG
ncbi:MAG: SPFH domain-containing protein [Clostridia bacterium]|nr:SPFH domain-containing protein [Clostridia bacterium]